MHAYSLTRLLPSFLPYLLTCYRYLATLLPCYLTTLLPYYLTTLLPYYRTYLHARVLLDAGDVVDRDLRPLDEGALVLVGVITR